MALKTKESKPKKQSQTAENQQTNSPSKGLKKKSGQSGKSPSQGIHIYDGLDGEETSSEGNQQEKKQKKLAKKKLAERAVPASPKTSKGSTNKPLEESRQKRKPNAHASLASADGSKKSRLRGSKAKAASAEPRPIVENERRAELYEGDEALTADDAKELLGWTEESENVTFAKDYLWKDFGGNKIRCLNNNINRPIRAAMILTLAVEILRRNWKFNGETIVIGKTRVVLNGQHRLLALILATQMWEAGEGQWKDFWDRPPTIDVLLVFGVEEGDDTVNTMDTGSPRTLEDVLYRSSYFSDLEPTSRKAYAKMASKAVGFLWSRTGAKDNALAPVRTHKESISFIERHPSLLSILEDVYEADADTHRLAKICPLGYAVGLCYLMGASGTETDASNGYLATTDPTEKQIDWGVAKATLKKAVDYFGEIADQTPATKPIYETVAEAHSKNTLGGSILPEVFAILIKGWNRYSQGRSIRSSDLTLEYEKDEEGNWVYTGSIHLRGIDLGDEANRSSDESEE